MPILDIKLVNRTENNFVNNTPFNGSADIDFDQYGSPVLCTAEEGLEQNVLKAVITGKQPDDGYGTNFKKLIGKTNTDFVRVSLMHDIVSSLSVLKKYQTDYISQNPTYEKKSTVGKIENIKSNPAGRLGIEVQAKIRSLDDIEKNSDELQQVSAVLV